MSETFGIDLAALTLAEPEAHAKELGLKLDEFLGVATSARQPNAAKYRDPKDGSNIWSGWGRKPAWFVAAFASGAKAEDRLIG